MKNIHVNMPVCFVFDDKVLTGKVTFVPENKDDLAVVLPDDFWRCELLAPIDQLFDIHDTASAEALRKRLRAAKLATYEQLITDVDDLLAFAMSNDIRENDLACEAFMNRANALGCHPAFVETM